MMHACLFERGENAIAPRPPRPQPQPHSADYDLTLFGEEEEEKRCGPNPHIISLARTDNPDAIDSEMRSGGDDDGGDDDFYVDSPNAAE